MMNPPIPQKNQKIKKGDQSPYSGILISEEQFRLYEYAVEENHSLNKFIYSDSVKPNPNCESCFQSNVSSGVVGMAIGVLATSLFFLLTR